MGTQNSKDCAGYPYPSQSKPFLMTAPPVRPSPYPQSKHSGKSRIPKLIAQSRSVSAECRSEQPFPIANDFGYTLKNTSPNLSNTSSGGDSSSKNKSRLQAFREKFRHHHHHSLPQPSCSQPSKPKSTSLDTLSEEPTHQSSTTAAVTLSSASNQSPLSKLSRVPLPKLDYSPQSPSNGLRTTATNASCSSPDLGSIKWADNTTAETLTVDDSNDEDEAVQPIPNVSINPLTSNLDQTYASTPGPVQFAGISITDASYKLVNLSEPQRHSQSNNTTPREGANISGESHISQRHSLPSLPLQKTVSGHTVTLACKPPIAPTRLQSNNSKPVNPRTLNSVAKSRGFNQGRPGAAAPYFLRSSPKHQAPLAEFESFVVDQSPAVEVVPFVPGGKAFAMATEFPGASNRNIPARFLKNGTKAANIPSPLATSPPAFSAAEPASVNTHRFDNIPTKLSESAGKPSSHAVVQGGSPNRPAPRSPPVNPNILSSISSCGVASSSYAARRLKPASLQTIQLQQHFRHNNDATGSKDVSVVSEYTVNRQVLGYSPPVSAPQGAQSQPGDCPTEFRLERELVIASINKNNNLSPAVKPPSAGIDHLIDIQRSQQKSPSAKSPEFLQGVALGRVGLSQQPSPYQPPNSNSPTKRSFARLLSEPGNRAQLYSERGSEGCSTDSLDVINDKNNIDGSNRITSPTKAGVGFKSGIGFSNPEIFSEQSENVKHHDQHAIRRVRLSSPGKPRKDEKDRSVSPKKNGPFARLRGKSPTSLLCDSCIRPAATTSVLQGSRNSASTDNRDVSVSDDSEGLRTSVYEPTEKVDDTSHHLQSKRGILKQTSATESVPEQTKPVKQSESAVFHREISGSTSSGRGSIPFASPENMSLSPSTVSPDKNLCEPQHRIAALRTPVNQSSNLAKTMDTNVYKITEKPLKFQPPVEGNPPAFQREYSSTSSGRGSGITSPATSSDSTGQASGPGSVGSGLIDDEIRDQPRLNLDKYPSDDKFMGVRRRLDFPGGSADICGDAIFDATSLSSVSTRHGSQDRDKTPCASDFTDASTATIVADVAELDEKNDKADDEKSTPDPTPRPLHRSNAIHDRPTQKSIKSPTKDMPDMVTGYSSKPPRAGPMSVSGIMNESFNSTVSSCYSIDSDDLMVDYDAALDHLTDSVVDLSESFTGPGHKMVSPL